jgi:hypothetical protein
MSRPWPLDDEDQARVSRRDWAKEYLGLEIAIKLVSGIEEAIDHIRAYSSGHTEVIVTKDLDNADTFVAAIDAAAVGSTSPPDSPTGESSASVPRSASPRRSCTPAVPWASSS